IINASPNNMVAGYGVEVEAEFDGDVMFDEIILANITDDWLVKQDGSLRGVSAEYVSRLPPKSVTKLSKLLDTLYAMFETTGFQPSKRCGVHVHVNFLPYKVRDMIHFVLLYYMMEDVLMGWVEEHRRGNLF